MKKFNITGTCIPERHYMVDNSKKIDKIVEYLIKDGEYFTINRPRQYGKTTTMYFLGKKLKDNYLLIRLSFEGLGEEAFKGAENFSKIFIEMIVEELEVENRELCDYLYLESKQIEDFKQLSKFITILIKKLDKKVVLMIDEVDKSSNNQLFLHFIGMLRDKYLKRNEGRDYTFHSVILAGVHDVKNMKLKLTPNAERQYNSPWNIAVDFDIDMSFDVEEIKTMLIDYEEYNKTGMDIDKIAKKLREFTSGYPFLVSKLCKTIDEKLNKEFTEDGIEKSIKLLLDEKNTLFDDVIKNIDNNPELKNTVENIILEGKRVNYNVDADDLGVVYGILKKGSGGELKIHNKIFEIRLYNYLIALRDRRKGIELTYKYRTKFIDDSGVLNMNLVLEKFQDLMKTEYRSKDEKFIEREGRLIFLAFLKPIINGVGFYFVEPETRQDNRMDIVVTYNRVKYIIELKIWHGAEKREEAREQLANYLDSQHEERGYLVQYSFNKNKKYERLEVMSDGKKIYEVIV